MVRTGLRQRSADSEMTIRLVDEAEGRELNHTWRQKDYATNVLSFPADVPDEFLDIPLLGDLRDLRGGGRARSRRAGQGTQGPLGALW